MKISKSFVSVCLIIAAAGIVLAIENWRSQKSPQPCSFRMEGGVPVATGNCEVYKVPEDLKHLEQRITDLEVEVYKHRAQIEEVTKRLEKLEAKRGR
jgi:hypothetical protein